MITDVRSGTCASNRDCAYQATSRRFLRWSPNSPAGSLLISAHYERNVATCLQLVLYQSKEMTMKAVLASSLLALGLLAAAPATAQRLEIGPDGPSVDLRSRGQRERDIERREFRRDRQRDEMRRDPRGMSREPQTEDDED
jgi:hypothetical protein